MDRDNFFLVGRQIRSYKILCIDHTNTNRGVMVTADALKLAEEQGLDLVQVNPGNKGTLPTCKIVNYGKFKYEMTKKQKAAAKHQRESEVRVKEIKFRPTTDANDLKIKAKHVEDFLNDGCRVKVSLIFKGREITHQNVGIETFNEFLKLIPNGQLLGSTSMEGKILNAMIVKKSDNRSEHTAA